MFILCGFTNFSSQCQLIYIISISGDCKLFIFKICKTVAGVSPTSQFHEFFNLIFGGYYSVNVLDSSLTRVTNQIAHKVVKIKNLRQPVYLPLLHAKVYNLRRRKKKKKKKIMSSCRLTKKTFQSLVCLKFSCGGDGLLKT